MTKSGTMNLARVYAIHPSRSLLIQRQQLNFTYLSTLMKQESFSRMDVF